jgi:hypothetical protein
LRSALKTQIANPKSQILCSFLLFPSPLSTINSKPAIGSATAGQLSTVGKDFNPNFGFVKFSPATGITTSLSLCLFANRL